jgi:hypothetical protein
MTLQQAAPEAPAQYAKAWRQSGICPRIVLAAARASTRRRQHIGFIATSRQPRRAPRGARATRRRRPKTG